MAKIATKYTLDGNKGAKIIFADESELVMEVKELSKEMLVQLAIHGLKQKVGDSYSGVSLVVDAFNNAKRVWEQLKSGVFNASGGGQASLVAEAIARIKKISVDEAQDLLSNLDDEQFTGVAKNAKVKAMVNVIKGERAQLALANSTDELSI